jgi:hypothetical protein
MAMSGNPLMMFTKWSFSMNNTAEITLTPKDIRLIQKIIEDNKIDTQYGLITLTKTEGFGIGSVLEMTWYDDHNGYRAKIAVEVFGVEDW